MTLGSIIAQGPAAEQSSLEDSVPDCDSVLSSVKWTDSSFLIGLQEDKT